MSEKLVLMILKHSEKLNIDKLKSQIMNRKSDDYDRTRHNKQLYLKPMYLSKESSKFR